MEDRWWVEGWRKGARLKERGASRVYRGASFSLSRNNKRIACHLEFDIALLSSMMPPPAETERASFCFSSRVGGGGLEFSSVTLGLLLKVDFFEIAEKCGEVSFLNF